MVVIATRVPKETKQKLLELCTAIYGKDKVGPCLKELVRDAIIAYYRLKPSRVSQDVCPCHPTRAEGNQEPSFCMSEKSL